MLAETPEQRLNGRPMPVRPCETAAGLYRLYGLRVRSEIRLPMPQLSDLEGTTPDIDVRRHRPAMPVPDGPLVSEQRCSCLRHRGEVISSVYQGRSGTWMRFADIGTFFLAANGRDIDAYPAADLGEGGLGLAFASQVCVALLHARGYPSLHASAIVTDGGAIAFLGPSGRGKSTLAASFLEAGATLLTDDILAIDLRADGVYGLPSLPIMKLGPLTLDHTLHLTADLPAVMPGQEKKLLPLGGRYAFAQQPVRLRGVYVLDRRDPLQTATADVAIRRLGTREAFTLLLGNMAGAHLLPPSAASRSLPLITSLSTAVPIGALRYPSGFEFQPAVRSAVLSDQEGR